MTLKEVLEVLVVELVDKPDEVYVEETVSNGGNTRVLTVNVAYGEVGKIIGKQGRNARAIRHILESIAAKAKTRVVLEIADSAPPRKGSDDDGRY